MPAEESSSQFPATRWTMVVRAGSPETGHLRRRAVEDICRAYWFPLYAFARGRGVSPEDAEDLTQSFFASILHTEFFAKAEQDRGKLRTYLLTAFTRHLVNAHRDQSRLKRGGGQTILSIEMDGAEERLLPARGQSIEALYDKHWALALVDAAMAGLEKSYAARGKAASFEALRALLEGEADDATYQTAAAALKLSITAARMEVYRMRQKYRAELRRAIADTLNDPSPEDVEAELRELKRALGE